MISGIYKVFFLGLLFSVWKILAKRYLHPLSRYPGPFLWSVSRAPYATAYAQGKLHKRIQRLHDQYGQVVRVAPDELSYQNEEAWKDIYGPSRNFPKDMRFYHMSKSKAPSVVVAPDSIHGRQKRAILRAFSVSALESHERLLCPFVDTLIQMLHPKAGNKQRVVDMTEWYNYVMFDFMAFELFGESLHCLEKGASHTWVDMLFGSIKAWAFLSQSKYFPSLSWIIKAAVFLLRRDLFQHRSTKFAFISSKVHEDSVSESNHPNFGTYIRASNDHKSTLSREEILSNYSFMMMAGSETTATLLSGCTFFILKHPEIYQKLSFQIRHRFSSRIEITFSSLADMPYLRAILQESLRMYPPLPLGMPRVVPKGGALVSGQFVPENTSVAVASWAAYQCSSNFRDPQSFIPERWLDTDIGGDDVKEAMQPFSTSIWGGQLNPSPINMGV
ncbi:cytochrome P450 monooxygenase [Penicillium canariense]|uniref:Cytochrome P450 monooxygenase n=1 Tax=Penicillium canariense TaxID=189055 RepID=A0A9W9HL01_9EURO|nr:cytochrome P450 monooxygenase [Penicillium canariense]KAJ5150904.1 cytochrome P450 monooxygenase [Penicillium canariense]